MGRYPPVSCCDPAGIRRVYEVSMAALKLRARYCNMRHCEDGERQPLYNSALLFCFPYGTPRFGRAKAYL